MVFELRTLNRSLQQKALNLDEDSILDRTQAEPLSLLSEIQQSQVPTETHTPSNSTVSVYRSCVPKLVLIILVLMYVYMIHPILIFVS